MFATVAKKELITEHPELLKKMLDSLPALVYINELATPNDPASIRNIYLNKFGHEYIRYSRQEIDELGSLFFQEIMHPSDMEIIPKTVHLSNAVEECFVSMHRLKPKGSEKFEWHYDHGTTFETFDDGSPRRSLVVSVNINDTIATQNQLVASLKEINRLNHALRLSILTPREKEVLHLIVKGRTDKEISCELFISTQTAKKHRNNLIHKTGVCNTAELVAFAVETGEY